MALIPVVFGPAKVTYNSIDLGYTSDGARLRIEPRWTDVQSDDYGGKDGAPADAQTMLGVAVVTLDLTKYDKAEVEKLQSFTNDGAAGQFAPVGTLIRQEGKFAELKLTGRGVGNTRAYANAFPRGAQEVNQGSRHSIYLMTFEVWVNLPDDQGTSRKLYTDT